MWCQMSFDRPVHALGIRSFPRHQEGRSGMVIVMILSFGTGCGTLILMACAIISMPCVARSYKGLVILHQPALLCLQIQLLQW